MIQIGIKFLILRFVKELKFVYVNYHKDFHLFLKISYL